MIGGGHVGTYHARQLLKARRRGDFDGVVTVPYEHPGLSGELYLSAAAWRCPATCIEPAHCPVLHAPRDWDLADIIEERAASLGYLPAVFRCLHFAGGVGAVAVGDMLAARDRLASAPAGGVALVALSSRCHAAVGALGLG